MTSLYQLRADFLPAGAQVVSFEGEEALNRPYRFQILFTVPVEDGLALDLDGATGKTARFAIHPDTRTASRTYSGTVAALELVEDALRHSIMRLHLVPKLWRLGLGEHSRVFVGRTLPEILKETLEAGGMAGDDYQLRLTGKYRPLAHVCQLRESRLAFITRWLERVGAYYFFEQGEDQEKLVVTDSSSSHSSSVERPVRFVPQHAGDVSAKEALRSFRWCHRAVPRMVIASDYQPTNPALPITESAEIADGGPGSVHLFKINEERPEGAKAYADVLARAYASGRTTCHAHGRVFGLMPGFTFDLEEHPRGSLNRSYLCIEIRHQGSDHSIAQADAADEPGDRYRCELTAVDAGHHWVPPPTTPWPRVAGTVRARVDGPADSEFAQLDEHGRYLVRLMLDESGLPDGGASTRIRMSQPHAGNPEGMHFPLRKGTEVQVAFIGGDPDQPIVLGAIPNAHTPSPVTAKNRTQNVLMTGGRNRLEIDDTKGSEYIDLSTVPESTFMHLGAHAGLGTHNYVFSTGGDYSMHTGGNRNIRVGGNQTETVTGNVHETYHSNQTTTVAGSLTETIDGGATQTIHAGSTQTIDGGATQFISGGETRTVTGGQTETIDGGRTQTIGGSSTETVTGDLSQTITGGATISTGGAHTVCAAGGFELSTPATITLIAGGGFNLLAPGGQTRLDDDFTLVGGEYKVFAPNQAILAISRIDLRMAYFEFIGVKADYFGIKVTTGSVSIQTAALFAETLGLKVSKSANMIANANLAAHGS